MSIVRLIVGGILGLLITLGLFVLMYTLIESADKSLDDKKIRKLPDIHLPDRDIETNLDANKPDKPDEPEEPPPDLDTPEIQDIDVSAEAVNISPNTKADVNISATGFSGGGGEYLPIVKVAPIYPRRAQTRGITGYCTVEYTVTKTGAISNPVAVDCQPKGIFEKASVKASLKFKYKPRVVDGEAVDVAGVQNRFTYELEQ